MNLLMPSIITAVTWAIIPDTEAGCNRVTGEGRAGRFEEDMPPALRTIGADFCCTQSGVAVQQLLSASARWPAPATG